MDALRSKYHLLFPMLYNSLQVAPWEISAEGRIFWDDNLFELYGMEPGDDLTAENFVKKIHHEDGGAWADFMESLQNKESVIEVNVRILIGLNFQWVRIVGKKQKDGSVLGFTQNVNALVMEAKDAVQVLKMVKSLAVTGPAALGSISNVLKDR